MRNLHLLDRYRLTDLATIKWFGGVGDETCGAFRVSSPIDGAPLTLVASSGLEWDHVSVSRRNRVPNQVEMDYIYRLFFADDETAVQYFVPRPEHVNNHPHCLHLWRPQNARLPKPPSEMVGIGNSPLSDATQAQHVRDQALEALKRTR
jgi:hypothetical protein